MKRIWEAIGSVVITGMLLYMFFQLIRPYALIIVLILVLGYLGERFYRNARRG